MAASLVVTIILRFCLIKENRRRTNLSPEEYKCEAAIKEPCDRVSSYLIFLIYNVVLSFLLASRRTLQTVILKPLLSNKIKPFLNSLQFVLLFVEQ
jgi:hypothetical protein